MGVNATTHGFRASFRTWCADRATPFELAESALGHSSNAIVAAYQRSGLVERRRPLMESWSKFLSGEESATPNIVPFEPKPARVS
jgi:integrase